MVLGIVEWGRSHLHTGPEHFSWIIYPDRGRPRAGAVLDRVDYPSLAQPVPRLKYILNPTFNNIGKG